MGRIVVTEYISLDGVIEAPGGTEDYRHVDWAMDFHRGPEGDAFKEAETRASDALLLGRVTYEEYAKAWPYMEGEVAEKLNSVPKHVVSSTSVEPLQWNNSSLVSRDVIDEVTRLRDAVSGDVVVHGSAQLAKTLFEHDMVDELRLMLYPIVLGTGKRLFGEMSDKRRWQLTESRTVGDGITILVYQRARRRE
jgi:dihydrofolate reductase